MVTEPVVDGSPESVWWAASAACVVEQLLADGHLGPHVDREQIIKVLTDAVTTPLKWTPQEGTAPPSVPGVKIMLRLLLRTVGRSRVAQ